MVRIMSSLVLLGFSLFAHGAAMTTAEKADVLTRLRGVIHENYVVPTNVEKIDRVVGELQRASSLNQELTPEKFALLITQALQTIDLHFGVQWREEKQSVTEENREDWFSLLRRKNSGFDRVEVLDGNIGYVSFWGFDMLSSESRSRVKAVMGVVENTDALIFDLRKNGGGSAEMVQLISSYLFDKPVHLNSIYSKPKNTTTEYWTLENIEGRKRPDIPVYVLISADTFSAAEEFAYNLKQLHRATVIGRATRGGANPWQSFELPHGFSAAIPVAMAINPISGTNWEHIGVEPDINVASDNAYGTAYKMALTTLKKTTRSALQLKEIDSKLVELSAGVSSLN